MDGSTTDSYPRLGCHDDNRSAISLDHWVSITHVDALKGSAAHILAQPTTVGDGLESFMAVPNDSIVITEKVCTSSVMHRTSKAYSLAR